jgi:AraC-like DNA-binding protein
MVGHQGGSEEETMGTTGSGTVDRHSEPHRPDPLESTAPVTASEAPEYSRAVRGVEIETIRTGQGTGPTLVSTTRGDGFVATGVRAGFPTLGRSTIGDDQIVVACFTHAPTGSRWCEIDLEPGSILIYGPGAEHAGVGPAGLEYALAVTTLAELGEMAETLGTSVQPPPRGEVHALAPSRSPAITHTLYSVLEAAEACVPPAMNHEDDILHAIIGTLSQGRPRRRIGASPWVDNRRVVHTCVEYAEAIQRLPSSPELCGVAHVSERRLQMAFTEIFGMAPTPFFQTWALDQARRHLLHGDAPKTVTEVATDLGFAHIGRFSGRYRQRYGETPSTTLASRYG